MKPEPKKTVLQQIQSNAKLQADGFIKIPTEPDEQSEEKVLIRSDDDQSPMHTDSKSPTNKRKSLQFENKNKPKTVLASPVRIQVDIDNCFKPNLVLEALEAKRMHDPKSQKNQGIKSVQVLPLSLQLKETCQQRRLDLYKNYKKLWKKYEDKIENYFERQNEVKTGKLGGSSAKREGNLVLTKEDI